jgi:hypothetical protein
MKFRFAYLLLAAVLMVSCERKLRAPDMNGSGSNGLIGNWNLVSTNGITIASSEMDFFGDLLKIEAISKYVSSNPKGYYKISSSSMDGVGIGYDFTGSVILNSYENNRLESSDTTGFPFSTVAPVNNINPYKTVGSDSLTFTNNGTGIQTPTGGTMTSPGGCRYKIEGNKLTMTIKHTSKSTGSSGGIPTSDKQIIDVVVILQKQ